MTANSTATRDRTPIAGTGGASAVVAHASCSSRSSCSVRRRAGSGGSSIRRGKSGATVEVQRRRRVGRVRASATSSSTDGVIGSSLVVQRLRAPERRHRRSRPAPTSCSKNMGVRDAVDGAEGGTAHRLRRSSRSRPGSGSHGDREPGRRAAGPERATRSSQATRNNAVRSKFEPEGVNNLEGLLWPDTYKRRRHRGRDRRARDDGQRRSTSRPTRSGSRPPTSQGHTPYDILKIASLIEAEAKVDEDRPLIASVIYNRLRAEHAAADRRDRASTRAATRRTASSRTPTSRTIKSPYNTYLHNGLPPTPIGGVSDASLRAALAPAQTDYLYYVLVDKDGHHAFASTLEEHAAEHRSGAAGRRAVITGATRVAGVIGDPVRHSLSPALHNAAYRELGLDWVYVAFEVPDGERRRRARRDARRSASSACRSRCRTRPRRPSACDELSADAAAAAQRQHGDARRPTDGSPATRPTARGSSASLARRRPRPGRRASASCSAPAAPRGRGRVALGRRRRRASRSRPAGPTRRRRPPRSSAAPYVAWDRPRRRGARPPTSS